jgi:energy-coupling factor transporter ATP-binding protein EcfA2
VERDGKIVELEDLSFTYRGERKKALRDISLEIREGEFVVWMGHTGAGKSTLACCLNALIPGFIRGKLSGEARVLGRDIPRSSTSDMSGEVGLVLQDFEAQLFSTNVELEMAFGMENIGVPRGEMKRRVDQLLPLVRLESMREREPSTLSDGQKQRLAIASVLAMRPRILIMDEPTSDLDPLGKEEVLHIARDLRGTEMAMVLIEHEIAGVLQANRIVLLKEGRLLAEGPPEKILNDGQLLLKAGVAPLAIPEFFRRALGASPPGRALPLTMDEAIPRFKESLRIREGASQILEARDRRGGATRRVVLKTEGLCYRYPSGVEALRGVNFEIGEGEFVALVGQNGSGKTTLAKHFIGLLRPSSGRIEVFGEDSVQLSVARLAKKVGYVFQNPDHQIFASTVFEEVSFGPRNFGQREKEVRESVEAALAAVNLVGSGPRDPFALTKGERQRVAVASVLAVQPQVLILDEPTTGLDYLQQQSMMEMVSSLNRKGHTILVITHSMSTVASYAHRTVVLDRGTVVMDDTTRHIFSRGEALKRYSLNPPSIVTLSNGLGVTALTLDELLQLVEPLDREDFL